MFWSKQTRKKLVLMIGFFFVSEVFVCDDLITYLG